MTRDEVISIHHQEGWPIDDQRIEQFMRYDYQQVRLIVEYRFMGRLVRKRWANKSKLKKAK
jgi:hypothetical protein